MATKTMKYSLDNIMSILFNGFDYKLPDETLNKISEIALQVGSPDYVKTPVFQKRENPMKTEPSTRDNLNSSSKKNKRNKAHEVINDTDWDAIRTITGAAVASNNSENKSEFDMQIDNIRLQLNKITDKNYDDISVKIFESIDKLIGDNISSEDMSKLSRIIFDLATNNRFYSKIYADLYSEMLSKYDGIKDTFETNLNSFTELFSNIEYVDSSVDYDKYCENNKKNERRRSLATFYVNLTTNGIISTAKIMQITRDLISQFYSFILIENKKNEVDELTENIAILYKKELYEDDDGTNYEPINGFTINEIIERISASKVKDYKSLTNKSLFKFMDLIEM
jgi:hypothetical protein